MFKTPIVLPSPAKLNLFLHILRKRPDGYHDIQTVFQFLDFFDEIQFLPRRDNRITFETNHPDIDPHDNLVVHAVRALKAHTHCEQGITLRLNKKLPIGGGVGGGSSNAATTLLGLNTLWALNLDRSTLLEIGKQLGADVPIFLHGHAAWAEGIGDELTDIILPEPWYVLLISKVAVNTAQLFQDPRLTCDSAELEITSYKPMMGHNDFEKVVRMDYPQIAIALDWLNHYSTARMTGTGCAVYAGFDTSEEASRIASRAPSEYHVVVAKGLNHSPLQIAVANCHWGVAKR